MMNRWFVLGAAMAAAAPAAGAPQRIVSLNKCADQILVALVDPVRIASVSPIGTDELSFLAEKLASLPTNSGRGESILLTDADLVIAGPFEGRARRDLLTRQGFTIVVLDPWTSLEEGKAQIRALALRLDVVAAGERLVADIEAALAESRAIAPPRRVLVLQRRGYTPGSTSILDEVLRHMGLTPHTDRLRLPQGGIVSIERLVADPPDYLLMGEGEDATDQGSALLRHPALTAAVPPERRLYLPARLTICGGPATPVAIRALAAEVRAKVR
jgi:iron complex transport system substrate-binding protein